MATEAAIHNTRVALSPKGPGAESRWNKYGWWRRVADDPPTYVPVRYSATAPRTEATGEWFVDPRDGKRMFVPHGNEVLEADARAITTTEGGIPPIRYKLQSPSDNLKAMFPVLSGETGSFGGAGGIGSGSCAPSGGCAAGP